MGSSLINLAYLAAAVLFIGGIKGLTHPRTAVRGNLLGAVGMLIAVAATLFSSGIVGWWPIMIGLIIGTAIGMWMAVKVPMTGMPQMVGLLNGLGGAASLLVALAEVATKHIGTPGATASAPMMISAADFQFIGASMAAVIIGAVTLTGSLVAAGKLQELKWIPDGNLFSLHQPSIWISLAGCLILAGFATASPETRLWMFIPVTLLALILGILLTTPIGGADMPVVIALLNAYSGLAASATGFVLNNDVLIIAGSLVGASGLILTRIMCKAMNRSLANVLLGKMGATGESASADEVYGGKVKSTSPEEVAMLFDTARKVVIAPGYGMAVAQCQHAVRDLTNLLEAKGITVEFAIHPVAGRMPGHMNVLLAEANIPYDKLREMDDINPEFAETDVVLVIGANDVVNPVARTDPKSVIAGMPILDVDKARTVVVVKRSLSPGFAGIPNPLFAADNTLMLFGDGKKALLDLIAAVKEG